MDKQLTYRIVSFLKGDVFDLDKFQSLTDVLHSEQLREQFLYQLFTRRKPLASSLQEGLLYAVTRDTSDWPAASFVKLVRRTEAFLRKDFAADLARPHYQKNGEVTNLAGGRLDSMKTSCGRPLKTP
jgi:hypothetical protein